MASALKMAKVAGCILLVVAASMGYLQPVMADCAGACADACQMYATALCSGFNGAKCTTPLPLGKTCEDVAIQPCVVSCFEVCILGDLRGCIA
ncbi:unnamed protein product [Urochloa decumbens]|uniref:Uncharacterized protein n=1 Tax=Urochloa decumbens TaxID=240449 RepID=A0ABC9G9C3_9POAL